jgi:hypothetical protein
MAEKIMTKHPQGKSGVNISRVKYDTVNVKAAIINTLQQNDSLTLSVLTEQVNQALAGNFDGSISWYVTTVKLDLEARGLIERVPKTSPQQLRLAGP